MKNGFWSLLLLSLVVVLPVEAADVLAPDVLAKNVTDEVLAILRADKDLQASNPRKAAALIEAKVLPHFDFETMTRLVMGRNWAQATPEQRKALTHEFRTLLLHTYTAALTLYRGQTIEYRPLRAGPGDTDVTVKSVVRQTGTEPIEVDYRMEKTGSGWKVYDVKLAGISLVENYRGTFSAEIQRNGIDGLIRALAEKNRSLTGDVKAQVGT